MPGASPWEAPPPPPPQSMHGSGGGVDRPPGPPPVLEANSIFDRLADQPMRVASIRLNGLRRTCRRLVERELENLEGATTLGGVRETLLNDWEVLAGLGAFSTVELAMEECSPVSSGVA
jgi:hypothetical protein